MPRIAVITPYFKEPLEVLRQCHESVLAQAVPADHFMVADGHARAELADWNVRHVVLPSAHGDGGNTPRGLGSMLADAEGYDFVAYLDADNWYQPRHLAALLETHRQSRSPVCTSFRTFHLPDGSAMDITEDMEDKLQHVDTSCYMLHRSAFEVLPVWSRMPRQVAFLCDRVFLAALRHRRFSITSNRERTVAYRTLWETHYLQAGLSKPEVVKSGDLMQPGWQWLATREGVDESVRRLGFWPLSYL